VGTRGACLSPGQGGNLYAPVEESFGELERVLRYETFLKCNINALHFRDKAVVFLRYFGITPYYYIISQKEVISKMVCANDIVSCNSNHLVVAKSKGRPRGISPLRLTRAVLDNTVFPRTVETKTG